MSYSKAIKNINSRFTIGIANPILRKKFIINLFKLEENIFL